MTSTLIFAAVLSPFIAAALAPLAAARQHARAGRMLALAFVPGLLLALLAPQALADMPARASLAWVPSLGLELTFLIDGFSLLFALIVAGIGVLVTLYAASYLGKQERHGRFYSYLLLFGGAMMGLVLTDNLIALFAFWELTSISSFLLIGFWDDRKASQDGAIKALLITALGGLALLAGVILLILEGGSVNLSELDVAAIQQSPTFIPAMALLLLGAFTKSAQIPFHLWLPTAMEAPTPVSAYLHSATMVKAGVVLVAKTGFLFAGTPLADVIMYVGLLTMFWGSYLALRQRDLKALLAYSTVSQLGILMALYGSGHAFSATAHLVNHAAFKAALFLVVGIIDHETGSRDLGKLSGLARKLPITFALAVPAALSMAGLPPLGGFISKELFYEAMMHQGYMPILIAVTGSIMTFAYSLRFLRVFVGPYRCEKPHVHEAPTYFWGPILPLSALALFMGLTPQIAESLTALAAPALGYHSEPLALWHGFSFVLLLSFLTWGAGVLLTLLRFEFAELQRMLTPSWNVNTLYYALVAGLERAAVTLTRLTQGATFASHLKLILLPFSLAGILFGWRAWVGLELTLIPLEFILLSFLVITGCVGTLRAKTRLSALIFMGVAGFSSVVAFALLRAPDLALTQLLIETVSVILFLSVFRFLPLLTRYTRTARSAAIDSVIALGAGFTVFTALIAVQTPLGERLKDFFLEASHDLAGGDNVVNVILVDFRGYDTMGEITVLAIAGITIYGLLKLTTQKQPELEPPDEATPAEEDA